MNRALITGITGQDGSYLAELLLDRGYDVHGIIRRRADMSNLRGVADRLRLHPGDVCDQPSLDGTVRAVNPTHVFHLAAQSFVQHSFTLPISTVEVTGLGTLRVLEAVRQHAAEARFYTAGSSEQFGKVERTPQNEQTPWHPRSPYGCAKVFAYEATRNYREAYGMFACTGILFNHESPRRGPEFVTRRITRGVAAVRRGEAETFGLGNLDARRDWGHARDYVRAMVAMLEASDPEDYVIGTGAAHSVREFLAAACTVAGLEGTPESYVTFDRSAIRPAEVDSLVADASKARSRLGWHPEVSFDELVREMVANDLSASGRSSASR